MSFDLINYVHNRNYCGDFLFPYAPEPVQINEFPYLFNFAEKMGNYLLEPLDNLICNLHDCHSSLMRVILVVTGIFAVTIGVLGLGIRLVGEKCNDNHIQRQLALEQLNKVMIKYNAIYPEKITDLMTIQKYVLVRDFDHVNFIFYNENAPRIPFPHGGTWSGLWVKFSSALKSSRPTDELEEKLCELIHQAISDEVEEVKAKAFIITYKERVQGQIRAIQEIRSLYAQYNSLCMKLDSMTLI